MYSTHLDLSFSYLRSAVGASLDIKKVQMEPNRVYPVPLNRNRQAAMGSSTTVDMNVENENGKGGQPKHGSCWVNLSQQGNVRIS
jgi:hypothetical protein